MKNNKIFKIIKGIIKTFAVIVLIGFIVVVCLQRFSDNKISIFSYRMFTVVTGSMEPKYVVGDVLISKEVDASTIKVGDVVTYLGDKADFAGKVITHQVVSIKQEEDGKYVFKTKGLANIVEDPSVSEDQIYGKVIYKSLVLSTIYRIVSTDIGFYLFIIIPLLYVIGSEIIYTMLGKEEKRRKKLKENNEDKIEKEEE